MPTPPADRAPGRASGEHPATAAPEPVPSGQGPAVAAVALGGVLGALARAGVGALAPAAPGTFPTATVAVNVVGSLLMGVLVGVVAQRRVHPLVRPFLGVGVLGGFTTFSTFTVDAVTLLAAGRLAAGLATLGVTVAAAVGAAALGTAAARALLAARRPAAAP